MTKKLFALLCCMYVHLNAFTPALDKRYKEFQEENTNTEGVYTGSTVVTYLPTDEHHEDMNYPQFLENDSADAGILEEYFDIEKYWSGYGEYREFNYHTDQELRKKSRNYLIEEAQEAVKYAWISYKNAEKWAKKNFNFDIYGYLDEVVDELFTIVVAGGVGGPSAAAGAAASSAVHLVNSLIRNLINNNDLKKNQARYIEIMLNRMEKSLMYSIHIHLYYID